MAAGERTRATGLRRVLRWTARIVLGLLAFAVFATAVIIGAIHTEWGRTKIKDEIVAELQAEFPGSSIRALEGSPFGTLVLRGVTVNGRDGKPMVTIERLAVDAALKPLVRKTVKVNSVRIDGVAVFVREQPPEPPRAPSAPSGPSEPSAWTVEVPSIEIHNGRVVVEMEGGDAETLDKLFVSGGVWLRPGSPLASIVSGKAMWRGKPVSAFATLSAGEDIDIPLATLGVGDARVAAYGATVTTAPAITGVLAGRVPAGFLPGIELPGELVADARGGGNIAVRGSYGIAQVDGQLVVDLDKLTARGLVTATASDLAVLTEGAAVGAATAVLAFDADGTAERARGVLSGVATIDDMPPAYAVATFDATPTRVEIVGGGETQGITARATATLEARGDDWHLAASDVHAHARRFDDVRGDVRVHATARGPLTPEPAIALSGTVEGSRITRDDLRIGELRGRFSADGLPARKTFTTHLVTSNIASGTTRVPMATLDVSASIADDDTITLSLGSHEVRAGDGRTWTGSGGTVTITEPRIVVEGVRTGSGESQLTASATVGRTNEDIEARVAARNVSLAIADPTLRGRADASLDVAFVGGRWRGGGTVTVDDFGASKEDPPLDITTTVKLAGRRIELTAKAKNEAIGETEVAFAVVGPRDVTDVAAWQRLPRTALERASVTLTNTDAALLGGTGRVSGELVLTATDARGDVHVTGVTTKAGALGATLSIAPGDDGAIRTTLKANVGGLPQVDAKGLVVLPARPFDPRAWQQLGRRALHEASVQIRALKVDPALLALFVEDEPRYSATVDASIVVATGATSTTFTADIRNIEGGDLTAPVDVHAEATTDAKGTRAHLTARAPKLAMDLTAKTPLTIDGALGGRAPDAQIEATLVVPPTAARDLLALFDRYDVQSGNVGGTITIDGAFKAPVLRAQVFAEHVAMHATGSVRKKAPKLERLDIDARWFAAERRAEFDIMGRESDNRLLKITGRGKPDDLESVAASIEAANFDLTPLAAFAPGQLRGARGTLNAALTIRGLDPESGDVRGMLQILDGRLPLSPELGTLRRATLDVQVIKQKIIAKLDGRAGTGGGSVKGTLTAQLEGGMPMSAKLDAKLVKLTPIGELQPQIDADITGDFVNEGARWTGRMIVSNGKVFVPPEAGNELLGAGKPGDLIFIDTMRGDEKKGRRAPEKPWLVMRIGIAKTDIEVDQQDVRVRAVAQGQLRVEVGDGVGMLGQITTERGTVDVLGRRYRLEQGLVDFDGLPDPRLEVRMVHDFKNLTLTVEILGRASDPYPRLTGDPGTYTQGQLLSFLAGAEPGNDDSQAQANQAVVSGGLTFLGSRIGRKLNKYVPIKFDSINYEAGTASSSRAVRFGVRVSEKTYLLWRQRLEARADENPGEVLLEYQISPNALFELTAGERAAGGDFLLRTRW